MILSASFQSIQANFAPNQITKIQSPEMQRTVDRNTAFISSFSNMRYMYILFSSQLVFSCSPHSCAWLSQHICGQFLLPSTVCFALVAQVLIVHILRTTPECWSTLLQLIVCQNTYTGTGFEQYYYASTLGRFLLQNTSEPKLVSKL